MSHVEYSSNNSGGSYWLKDEDWANLEKAGWEVQWFKNEEHYKGAERFLGALAREAKRQGLSLGDAIREWESVTGQSSNALGCSCCGSPHSFTLYNDEGDYVESYYPTSPSYGDSYYD
jgi:hypothetical protein